MKTGDQPHDPLEIVQSHLDTFFAAHPEDALDNDTDVLRPRHRLWYIVGASALVVTGAAVAVVEVINHVKKQGEL